MDRSRRDEQVSEFPEGLLILALSDTTIYKMPFKAGVLLIRARMEVCFNCKAKA